MRSKKQSQSLLSLDFMLTVAPLAAGTLIILPFVLSDVAFKLVKDRLREKNL